MRWHLLTALILCLLLGARVAQAQDRVMLVLDGSSSMWGQVAGKAKLEHLRGSLREVLEGYTAEIGLTAFGSRSRSSCSDVRQLVAPTGTAPDVVAAAEAMKFQGASPISAALRQAASDLRGAGGTPTVILVTDSVDSCSADPCAVAAELEAEGGDFTAHVIGLGLGAKQAGKVSCIATATGGSFREATDGATLTAALRELLALPPGSPPAPPAGVEIVPGEENFAPRAFLAAGIPVEPGAGLVWELTPLAGGTPLIEYDGFRGRVAPGDYRLSVALGLARIEEDLTIGADPVTPEIILGAAKLTVRPRPELRSEVSAEATVEVTLEDGRSASGTGETHFYLPAGKATVSATLDGATVREEITLTAGETLLHDVMITTGTAAMEIYYAEGIPVESGVPQVRILSAGAAPGTTPVTFAQGAEPVFVLSPGSYQAWVGMGAAEAVVPFTVSGGRETVVVVRLEAGLLTVEAPGAAEITVRDAATGVERATAPGSAAQWVMPGGTYSVQALRGGDMVRQDALVAAGARTDVVLPQIVP